MGDFNNAFAFVFGEEGGFVDNKNDRGGATKYGVSLRFLKGCGIDSDDLDRDGIKTELIGDFNNDGTVDAQDIRLLSPDMAKLLYYKYFWVPCMGGLIFDQRVAVILFDMAINSGVGAAVKCLQDTLNALGIAVAADGRIGPKTLAAVNNNLDKGTDLCSAFITLRKAFYMAIVKESPSQQGFLDGWMNRLNHLRKKLGLA